MNDIEKAINALKQEIVKAQTVKVVNGNRSANSDQASRRDSAGAVPVDINLTAEEAQATERDARSQAPEKLNSVSSRTHHADTEQHAGLSKAVSEPASVKKVSRTHKLPLGRLKRAGFITPKTEKNRITEEYRRLKRPLLKKLNAAHDSGLERANVIAVTSAMSGEGKTFSAINLAMSLALEKERTVLLIDADMVRHTAGTLCRVSPKEIGLIDMLEDTSIDAADVILNTNVRSLSFLPAGRVNKNATELLSSDAMSNLVTELSQRYDDRIIILDCPPVLQTNEAAILADHAGQVVFVVAEEFTSQALLLQAFKMLDEDQEVGILLNKSTKRFGKYDYYSYDYT